MITITTPGYCHLCGKAYQPGDEIIARIPMVKNSVTGNHCIDCHPDTLQQ